MENGSLRTIVVAEILYRLSNDADNDGIGDDLNCSLQRQYSSDGGTTWLPNPAADIAYNIDVLNFVFLDEDGNDLIDYTINPPAVPNDQLSNIRMVQITIVARAGRNVQQGLPNNKLDTHIYMNQQDRPDDDWDIILPVQNDRFWRKLFGGRAHF